MGRAGTCAVLVLAAAGCAKPPQASPNYVVPVIGLPPIPIDTTRPGLDVRPMPSAEVVAASEATVRVGADLASAMLERRPVRLSYPAEAAKRRLSGYVRFRVIIDREGAVQGMTLLEATNNVFVTTAKATVQSWQYRPFLVNGEALAVDTTVRVDFMPPD